MTVKQVRVTFEPHGRAVFVLPGTTILEASGRAGLAIDTPCGGEGTCGKCRVQIRTGATEPNPAEERLFDKEELQNGWRLACQTTITSETIIRLPEKSLFGGQHQILTEAQIGTDVEVLPAVRKIYVELPAATLEDNEADLLRLERKIGKIKTDLSLLRQLPNRLRQNNFTGTAVLADHRLIDFESGDTTSECYGAAFDIGTTTLVGSLLNLCTGEELAVTSRINPQVSFGDDGRIQLPSVTRG